MKAYNTCLHCKERHLRFVPTGLYCCSDASYRCKEAEEQGGNTIGAGGRKHPDNLLPIVKRLCAYRQKVVRL